MIYLLFYPLAAVFTAHYIGAKGEEERPTKRLPWGCGVAFVGDGSAEGWPWE